MFKHFLRNRSFPNAIYRARHLQQLSTGQKLKEWTVKEVEKISEFNMTASRLEHSCGGQLLYIQRLDQNATFSVAFKTVPMDSTGLPHILEHTVLCGSEQYPCRDPFFNMLNRSLATFMNAMTAPDWTLYPFSSQNPQDWKNLQSVYLDAVFKPRLHQTDFRQEGWRLEHEDPLDPSTPIVLKGVVFNEMKGVFSDNQSLYSEALLNGLLPSHTYGVCSGGLPLDIPKLRHQDLVNFHKKHYTAGNARFYMYGNVPVEQHLTAIEPYLKDSGASVGPIPPEPRWREPRKLHINCRKDPMAANPAKQSSITVNYLCADITDIDEVFALTVISQLLVQGPNAAFYKTLVEPGIGAGLAPTTGYESQIKDTFFSVGLQGVDPNDFSKIEKIVKGTLADVLKDGFPSERIEAILHSIELGVKHQSANFGLSLLFGVTPIWNHDGDVISALSIENRVQKFREALKNDPKFLQKKVKKYLVKNNHRLLLTMAPSDDFEPKQKEAEDSLLRDKLASLTEDDKKRIYEEGIELLESRKQENKEVLPTLRVSDIPDTVELAESEDKTTSSVPVSIFRQPTNGVSYFQALLGTDQVPEELQPFLPVFAHIVTRMGTKKRNFREFDQVASLYTGGLGVGCHVTEGVDKLSHEGSLLLGSHCLDRNIQHMFDLWEEVLKEGDLEDTSRFSTLIKSLAANLVNSVAMSGHVYAMLGASALVSSASAQQERNSGMKYLTLLKEIASGDAGEALQTIRKVRDALSQAPIRCALNTLPGTDLKPLDSLVSRLGYPGGNANLQSGSPPPQQSLGTFHVLPFDVSYASQVIPTVPYTHKDFAPLRILSSWISSKYLHPEVREKGGAYGGGASLSASGLFRFYSYRDPSPSNSLRVFDETPEWVNKNIPRAEDLEEAKLRVFQSVDAPIAPGDRGTTKFVSGVTNSQLIEHRKELMAVSVDDVTRVAGTYLSLPAGRCMLGPQNSQVLEDKRYEWKVVTTE